MRPWLVFAAHVVRIPLVMVCGAVQVVPPLAEPMKPTLSCVVPEGKK